MLFEVGKTYTRHRIHAALGGEIQTYLPQRDGRIVCGCFKPELDPEAPYEVLVGDAPKVKQKAEMLCQQEGVIPVFLKVHRNRWEYQGLFRAKRLSTESVEVRSKAQKLGRSDISSVLHLERVLSSELNQTGQRPYYSSIEFV